MTDLPEMPCRELVEVITDYLEDALPHDDRLRFGVCWYPEHWPRERWAEDLRPEGLIHPSCLLNSPCRSTT